MNILSNPNLERLMPSFTGLIQRIKRQVTAAGNWKHSLAMSGLPEDVQTTIRSLVMQTKLMRFEKSEITDELIAHFQDGHRRGQSWQGLSSTFGDPDVSAKLFRSTKLRDRPMTIKVGKYSLWTALTLGIGYFALAAFYNFARPNLKVDYSAKINEPIEALPLEQKAWPVYRDAWIKFGLTEGKIFQDLSVVGSDRNNKEEFARPGDDQWAKVVATINESQELFHTFREGAKLDHLGLSLHAHLSRYSKEDFSALFPESDYDSVQADPDCYSFGAQGFSEEADQLIGGSTVGIVLPHFGAFYNMSHALIVDSRLAATQSDPDRIVKNVDTTFGIARQLYNEPYSVTALISKAIFQTGVMHVEELISNDPQLFNAAHLKHLQQSIAQFEIPMKWNVAYERLITQDILQRTYSDDGNGDGRLTPVGLEILLILKKWSNVDYANDPLNLLIPWQQRTSATRTVFGPALMLAAPTRKEASDSIKRHIDAVEESFTANYWEEDYSEMEVLEDESKDNYLPGLYTSFSSIRNPFNSALATKNASLIAVAAHRFRKANKTWPQTLDDLIGEYLDEKPIDPVTGTPLKFKIEDDAIVVYSLGIDLDDDGGEDNSLSNPFLFKRPQDVTIEAADGDWVLWPARID